MFETFWLLLVSEEGVEYHQMATIRPSIEVHWGQGDDDTESTLCLRWHCCRLFKPFGALFVRAWERDHPGYAAAPRLSGRTTTPRIAKHSCRSPWHCGRDQSHGPL